MAVFLVISRFSLVLVNDDFLCLAVTDYRCSYRSAGYCRGSYGQSVSADCQNLVKVISLACLYAKLLNFDYIAFGYFVLFTTCCNDCVHSVAPPDYLLANFGDASFPSAHFPSLPLPEKAAG